MSTVAKGRSLGFAYGSRPVLAGVDVEVRAGEVVALLGPNGAGKSTLLHVLLGLLAPTSGEARLGPDPVTSLDRREIARRVAFVPQGCGGDFSFTVEELVTMGRTPYLGRFRPPGRSDLEIVRRALEVTGTTALAGRPVPELSGGERQRVHVARAIAQDTPALFLDEPTSSLDVEHQLQILGVLRRLAADGRGVLCTLHDLTLAARFADRLVVLSRGRVVSEGTPGAVLTESLLAEHFGIRARIDREPGADGSGPGVPVAVVPLEPAS